MFLPVRRATNANLKALESTIGQTYPQSEVVVSDNCSTDRTEALVKVAGSPRVRYFKHARTIRPNDNFNFCLRKARELLFVVARR